MERIKRGSAKGQGGKRGGKLMRICACEQVSAEKGGRRRGEEKSQRKSIREQTSVNSFTCKAFFTHQSRVSVDQK